MAWPFRKPRTVARRRAIVVESRISKVRAEDFDGGFTEWCRERAFELELPELARRVRVCWNVRMRTAAGRAWWPDRLIELNPKLQDFPQEEVWRTLRHELAHLVAYERCGRRRIEPHGTEWQTACAELGIPGESPYHDLPLKRRKMRKKFAYVCPECQSAIQRVKKIQRSVACYSCCRKFNGGAFAARYQLVERKLPS